MGTQRKSKSQPKRFSGFTIPRETAQRALAYIELLRVMMTCHANSRTGRDAARELLETANREFRKKRLTCDTALHRAIGEVLATKKRFPRNVVFALGMVHTKDIIGDIIDQACGDFITHNEKALGGVI